MTNLIQPLSTALTAAVLTLALAAPAAMAQQGDDDSRTADRDSTHTGQVVRATANRLVMSTDGEKHSHKVTSDTRITINGEPAGLEDLRRGDSIRVALGPKNTATSIKATRAADDESARGDDSDRGDRSDDDRRNAGAETDRPFLGVALAPSTGGGVLIPDVIPTGPAAEAGLRAGDYVLEVNGEKVSSPQEFDREIEKLSPGDTVDLLRWREGNKKHLQFKVGSRRRFRATHFRGAAPDRNVPDRDESRRSERSPAWLGVMLARPSAEEIEDQKGARIDRIYKGGPADDAGLEGGDVLLAINDQMVSGPEVASEILAGLEPDDEVNVTIRRDGEDQTMTVTLGDRSEFFGNRPQTFPDGEFGMGDDRGLGGIPGHLLILEQERRLATQHQRIEQLCEKLLDEVRALRKEVESLKNNLK